LAFYPQSELICSLRFQTLKRLKKVSIVFKSDSIFLFYAAITDSSPTPPHKHEHTSHQTTHTHTHTHTPHSLHTMVKVGINGGAPRSLPVFLPCRLIGDGTLSILIPVGGRMPRGGAVPPHSNIDTLRRRWRHLHPLPLFPTLHSTCTHVHYLIPPRNAASLCIRRKREREGRIAIE
jgi:hypothetical protein